MWGDFRHEDKGFREAMVEAVEADLATARRNHVSVDQIAAACTRGTDDPEPLTADAIYKLREGKRLRFPLHKIGRWCRVTGGTAVRNAVLRQCFAGEVQDYSDVAVVMRRTAEVIDAVAHARAANDDGTRDITAGEARKIARAANAAAGAVLGLSHAVQAEVMRPAVGGM